MPKKSRTSKSKRTKSQTAPEREPQRSTVPPLPAGDRPKVVRAFRSLRPEQQTVVSDLITALRLVPPDQPVPSLNQIEQAILRRLGQQTETLTPFQLSADDAETI